MSLCFSYEFQKDVIFGLCNGNNVSNWPNNIGDKVSKKDKQINFSDSPSL
jgi:hypothetical protein